MLERKIIFAIHTNNQFHQNASLHTCKLMHDQFKLRDAIKLVVLSFGLMTFEEIRIFDPLHCRNVTFYLYSLERHKIL